MANARLPAWQVLFPDVGGRGNDEADLLVEVAEEAREAWRAVMGCSRVTAPPREPPPLPSYKAAAHVFLREEGDWYQEDLDMEQSWLSACL